MNTQRKSILVRNSFYQKQKSLSLSLSLSIIHDTDNAWAMIQKAATYVLANIDKTNNEEPKDLPTDIQPPTNRMRRMSFTQSVSKDDLGRHNSLTDDGTPVFILETEENLTDVPNHGEI